MLYNIYNEELTFLDTIEVEGWSEDRELYENKTYFTREYRNGSVEIKKLVNANDFIYKTLFDHVIAYKALTFPETLEVARRRVGAYAPHGFNRLFVDVLIEAGIIKNNGSGYEVIQPIDEATINKKLKNYFAKV